MDVFNTLSAIERNSVFYAHEGTWQVWNKPKNANFVYFFLIGGGGGGGGGKSSGSNSAPGGGGGGSSAITTALFPAFMLPDTLYIKIGLGGLGGAGGTAGSVGSNGLTGGLSYISFEPNTTAINILLQSGEAVTDGGNGAFSTTGVGSGGIGGAAWIYTNYINGDSGLISTIVGQTGTAGTGTGASVNNLTPILPITGGAGGGCSSSGAAAYSGASIVGSSFLPTVSAGVNNDATYLINGNDGIFFLPNISSMRNPMFFTGGGGGAPATTTGRSGGNGGNGSFGSGGAGGGGSYNGPGGNGGKGGDGLALIVTL